MLHWYQGNNTMFSFNLQYKTNAYILLMCVSIFEMVLLKLSKTNTFIFGRIVHEQAVNTHRSRYMIVSCVLCTARNILATPAVRLRLAASDNQHLIAECFTWWFRAELHCSPGSQAWEPSRTYFYYVSYFINYSYFGYCSYFGDCSYLSYFIY